LPDMSKTFKFIYQKQDQKIKQRVLTVM
jgi:hypothetical protein